MDLSHVGTPLLPQKPMGESTNAQSWERAKVIRAWFHWEVAQEQKQQWLSQQHPLLGSAAKAQLCWVKINPNTPHSSAPMGLYCFHVQAGSGAGTDGVRIGVPKPHGDGTHRW